MPLHKKTKSKVLEHGKAELNMEFAKDNAIGRFKINELRKSIAEFRQALSELKQ